LLYFSLPDSLIASWLNFVTDFESEFPEYLLDAMLLESQDTLDPPDPEDPALLAEVADTADAIERSSSSRPIN
jgi:hypothetical protein